MKQVVLGYNEHFSLNGMPLLFASGRTLMLSGKLSSKSCPGAQPIEILKES